MKKVAVLQSDYLPWKGYFDIIHDVDEFIFHDDLQYTKGDWRNRNKIITNSSLSWLTIPVGIDEHRLICDVKLNDKDWQRAHFNKIWTSYHKSPFWNKYKDFFEDVFLGRSWDFLYLLDRYLIEHIACDFLGCTTMFSDSRDYHSSGQKAEKLLSLLVSAGTELYVSGPAAQNYIDERRFRAEGITVIWKDYDGYPEYSQNSKIFNHKVSILDLLFNVGDEAPYYIWGWRK